MPEELPVIGVVPVLEMEGDDEEETERLRELAELAGDHLSEYDWCKSIREFFFGDGIGGIFAVFLAQLETSRSEQDEFVWVIVGDLPFGIQPVDELKTPKAALEAHIKKLRNWVKLLRQGESTTGIIPDDIPASPEWAEALNLRLDIIQLQIMPAWFA